MSSRRPKFVRWLEAADAEFQKVLDDIEAVDPRASLRFADRIAYKVRLLADFPYLGSLYPFARGVRYLVHGNFVIYHTFHRREIVIREFVRGSRRFRRAWLNRQ